MVKANVRPTALCVGMATALALGGCGPVRETGLPPGGAGDAPEARTEPGPPPGAAGAGDRIWLDETRWLGAPVQAENLTVWPIHATSTLDIGEFLTLKEAEDRGVAVVREVGARVGPEGRVSPAESTAQEVDPGAESSGIVEGDGVQQQSSDETQETDETPETDETQETDETPETQEPQQTDGQGARVNTVVVENRGDLPILVCAGTVIKGGQQDRQIARDLVIGPRKTVPVDAFCVEGGRWTAVREGSSTAGLFETQDVVATKRVRSVGQFSSSPSDVSVSQTGVWAAVAADNTAAGNESETGTLLATIEDEDAETVERRARSAAAVRERFEALGKESPPPVGFAYSIDGRPVTVRTFAHPRLLEKQLDPFLKAMAIEADIARRESEADGREPYDAVAPASEVLEMVRRINEAREELSETGAENRNGIRLSEAGGNLNCYAEIFVHPGEAAAPSAAAAARRGTEPAAADAREATWVPVTQDWTAK